MSVNKIIKNETIVFCIPVSNVINNESFGFTATNVTENGCFAFFAPITNLIKNESFNFCALLKMSSKMLVLFHVSVYFFIKIECFIFVLLLRILSWMRVLFSVPLSCILSRMGVWFYVPCYECYQEWVWFSLSCPVDIKKESFFSCALLHM